MHEMTEAAHLNISPLCQILRAREVQIRVLHHRTPLVDMFNVATFLPGMHSIPLKERVLNARRY